MIGEPIENLIIGGGPAGSMTAMRLAEAGHRVVLLEKERASHHKVCGEFLSCEAVAYLRASGIEPLALGALPIQTLRVTAKGKTGETRLPFPALSLSRRVLDQVLVERARELGCDVQRGVRVQALTRDPQGWTIETVQPKEGLKKALVAVRGRRVFLASGKHDVHGWSRGSKVDPRWIGLKMHWRLRAEARRLLRETIELFLFRGGYAGLSLIEAGAANLCMIVRQNRFQTLGGWENLLHAIGEENPRFSHLLHEAEPAWQKPLAISPVPYGYQAAEDDRVWRVGDQVAVVPSFTGDGMAIALHSAMLAAQMALAGSSAAEFHRRLRGHLGRGMRTATRLSRAMVSAPGRGLAAWGLQLLPEAMRAMANATRIPAGAMIVSQNRPDSFWT